MTTTSAPATTLSPQSHSSTSPAKAQIELSLFAPTIDQAALVADFTDWLDQPMQKSPNGAFRIQLHLHDGDYYYKFRVRSKSWFCKDQLVTITDPYATHVEGATGNAILHVRGGQRIVDSYVWQHDAAPLPPNNKLVIYELHVADFSGGEADPNPRGKFQHVIEKLDYLADLGVNAIQLMPIKEYPGDYSWGYNPQYLFAPESAYGPPEQLKRLIDQAHSRGIRVFFDGVYNHCHTDAPLPQIDHDYWFHHSPKDPAFSWGPQYNYELWDEKFKTHPARKLISENIQYWVREFHIDGMRYDAARQIENFDALRMMSQIARQTAGPKPFLNIAEYLPEDPAVVTGENHPMDALWHDQFFWRISDGILVDKPLDLESIKDVIDPSRRGFSDCTQVVNYVSNHDHRRLMPRLAEHGFFEGQAFGRAHLACTLLLTSVGIPMIWMGGEFGEYKPKTCEPAKVDWNLLNSQPNVDLRNRYKRMIDLRINNEALQQNFIQFFHENPEQHILAFVRWNERGQRVVVIANFRDTPHDHYHIPNFPCPGQWHDWIADRPVQVAEDGLHTHLAGLEAKVLVWH